MATRVEFVCSRHSSTHHLLCGMSSKSVLGCVCMYSWFLDTTHISKARMPCFARVRTTHRHPAATYDGVSLILKNSLEDDKKRVGMRLAVEAFLRSRSREERRKRRRISPQLEEFFCRSSSSWWRRRWRLRHHPMPLICHRSFVFSHVWSAFR